MEDMASRRPTRTGIANLPLLFERMTGAWTVVQQGMNEATRYARRYHWLANPERVRA
jgi:hypothetical protein